MSSTIRIICENTTTELWVKMGTSLAELAKLLPTPALPYLAATVNNRLKELHYRIYKPVNVRFLDQTSYTGISVLHRTLVCPAASRRTNPPWPHAPHPPRDGTERLLLRD